jgi:hypothetical protein
VKRTGSDEPIGVVIYICMETPCVYFSQTSKMLCSLSIFYVFSSPQNQRTGRQNRFCGGWDGALEGREGDGGRGRKMNMLQIIYMNTYVNAKMIPVGTGPGIRSGG